MTGQGLISREGTVLVVIDAQEKLLPHVPDKEQIVKNITKLIRFADIVKIPVLLTEQYPKGLGQTVPELKNLIPHVQPIERMEFSCLGSERFRESLTAVAARTLILSGLEAQICIVQTAIEGIAKGYRIYVVSDAVSSRRLEEKVIALERMGQNGAEIVSTEMLIYEVLRKAGTPEFKEALKLVKM